MSATPDHERIWLQNAEDADAWGDGRLWCPDKVWPDDSEDGEPTEYVRADLYETLEQRLARAEAALAAVAKDAGHVHLNDETWFDVRTALSRRGGR